MNLQRSWILPCLFGGIFLFILLLFLSSSVTKISATAVVDTEQVAERQKFFTLESVDNSEENYSCRYGATVNGNDQTAYLDDLKVGWYSNFAVNFTGIVSSGIEYVPTIRLQQARDQATGNRLPDYLISGPPLTDDPEGLGSLVLAHPGSLWLVGNEVDRKDWQDDIMPEVYAKAYHDVYHFIKERDPSAQIANSGLVQVTPGRLQYLDIVWDTYLELYNTPMPVDVWNMHIYILPEAKIENGKRVPSVVANIALGTDINLAKLESDGTPNQCANDNVYCFAEHDDLTIFAEQVIAMRQWMKAHGQQQKPLIITEYSQLYPYIDDGNSCFQMDEYGNCFTEARVTQFMQGSINYLENSKNAALGYHVDDNRLVQQWLWYTVNNAEDGAPSNLVYLDKVGHEDGELTPMGFAYRQAATAQLGVNILPKEDNIPLVIQDSDVATLTVSVMNNGAIPVSAPFTVTFYADEAMTQEIGAYQVIETIGGCARDSVEASVSWSDLDPGLNQFWGLIDSGSDITDEDKSDNQFTGFVLVDPIQVFLPSVHRQ